MNNPLRNDVMKVAGLALRRRRRLINSCRESGFVTGGGVAVNHAFLNRLVNDGYGRGQQILRFARAASGKSNTQFLNRRANATPIAAIDFTTLFVLAHTLLC